MKNFPAAALQAVADLVAAALDHPNEFAPLHFLRRVPPSEVATFDQLYPALRWRITGWHRRSALARGVENSERRELPQTMGIIAVLLYSQGHLGPKFHVPFWVVFASQAAMSLGPLAGGWRIVRTMGSRITRLGPRCSIPTKRLAGAGLR